jgi:hypothetical protein
MRSSPLHKSISLYPKNIIDLGHRLAQATGETDVVHWSESQKKAQAFRPGLGVIVLAFSLLSTPLPP